MRLRLSVQRHRLPPTSVLWNVPDNASPQAYTIARLLEDVNAILPLEAEHWGLEDYIVEVGGFECLHFSPVVQALKDDDEVTIRPLLTAEVRSRTLCGRYQISEGGQHLVDGIPFGRPLLRTPSRPPIRIPPRKRQRLLEDAVAVDDDSEVVGLITANGEMSPQTNGVHLPNGDTNLAHEEISQRRRKNNGKSVHFGQLSEDQSDSDEDDEDFALDEESEGSDVSMESDSEDVSEESSDASDTSSYDSDSNSTSSSESDSESGESSGPEIASSKLPVPARTPPGKGKKVTKSRNRRRKDAQRLHSLKEIGILDASATLEDMRNMGSTETGAVDDAMMHASAPTAAISKKRKRNAEQAPTEQAPIEHVPSDQKELERRKQDLMTQVTQPTPRVEEPSTSESTPKRLRPNVSAITRILGHQTRALNKLSPKAKPTPIEEPEPPPDPDFWKSKINLSAFECWDEEHTLSAPPFPFAQHWDPASKLIREKASKETPRSKARRKRGKTSPTHAPATPNDSNETIQLDYGDAPASNERPDADATAAIESQILQDVATATHSDLPPLPDDIESLPALSQADIKVGAIIVFKLFVINPSNMNPEISGFKTALVEDEGDSGSGAGAIGLKLAERDKTRREKKFDRNGNRIYDNADRFRMEDSDEEDEDGLLYHHFGELLEAKLLKAA